MSQVVSALLAVLIVVLIALIGILLVKLRSLRVVALSAATKRDIDNLYSQIEAFDSLHQELGFERALPRLRGNNVSPDFLREIAQHVRRRRPQCVVECGSGASTVVLAKAMSKNGYGHVYSLDQDIDSANKTYRWLTEHGLTEWATVIYAEPIQYTLNGNNFNWYALSDLPNTPIDLMVINGPTSRAQKYARYPALFLLRARLTDHSAIVVNNTNSPDDTGTLALWAHDFPEFRFQKLRCEKGCAIGERVGPASSEVKMLTNPDVPEAGANAAPVRRTASTRGTT
jgi:predicted O-methyltransferase YrrM